MTEASEWLRLAAEQRADPAVMYRLGMQHLESAPREGDIDALPSSNRWLAEAAEMGFPAAQLEMGRLAREDAESELWLSRASENGCFEATGALGLMYAKSGAATKALRVGVRWLRRLRQASSKSYTDAIPKICFHEGSSSS